MEIMTMNWFIQQTGSKPRKRPGARLSLETLESRLAPANVFVVPFSQPADSTHLHQLAAAIIAAGGVGMVTIEPGASQDPNQPVLVDREITIQGDPSVPASILPFLQLNVQSGSVTLTNLNIDTLTIGSSQPQLITAFCTVSKCVIRNLTALQDTRTTYTQNIITGRLTISSDGHFGGDLIENNTFTTAATFPLALNGAPGTIVSRNAFFLQDSVENGIDVHNCGVFNGTPTTIVNNAITSPGGSIATGIFVHQDGTGVSDVKILDNRIETRNFGLSLAMAVGDNDHFRAFVEGNDFHNNVVGVLVEGDETANGNVDLGGGALGSNGGNNFRGFRSPADFNHAAILLESAPHGSVFAHENIFFSTIAPADVVKAVTGFIFVDQPLDSGQAFVQTLYTEVLGRTGSLTELGLWVNLLGTQGQAAVVNGIRLSPEALGRIVDQLYIRFLGRQSDAGGRAGWIGFLQRGGTLEGLENAFLTAPEYISHINTDYVQSLYLNILGRTGSSSELATWNNNIQNLGGLSGVANAFTHSAENRLNTLRSYFQTFLHRTPPDSELIPLVNSSQDLLSLEAMVLSSPEFFANG
jgi:hypothetical protein